MSAFASPTRRTSTIRGKAAFTIWTLEAAGGRNYHDPFISGAPAMRHTHSARQPAIKAEFLAIKTPC